MNHTKENANLGQICKTGVLLFLKYLGILIAAGVVGILLLTLVYCIPVNQESKESSLKYSAQMGWGPLVSNRYTQYISFFSTYEVGAMDDATDLIILNNCYNEGEESAIVRAADMNDYGRYWHGYVAILRPIFYFMDYWDYLLVNSFAQLFLMGCVGYAVFKVTGKKSYLLAFFCSCLFLTPVATAMSLQNSPVFYIAMLGSLLCLWKADWLLGKKRRYYLFLLLGILTCYFDFLTYPLLSFAFPFCWLLVAAGDKMDLGSRIRLLFGGGVSFIFGWGGFFGVKWIVQTIICGPAIIENGLMAVLGHLFSEMPAQYRILHQCYNRIDTVYNNFRYYLFPIFALTVLLWISVLFYKFLRGQIKFKAEQIIFAAVTLTAPAWYLILNSHTTYHHIFTHKIYVASLLGFMLFVCGCMGENTHNRTQVRVYFKRAAVLMACLVIGLGASRLAMEDKTTINGAENTEMHLAEGDVLEFEFTPAANNIKAFSFCIRTNDSTDGELLIDLYDGETLCEETEIPLNIYGDTVFELQLTDWRLTAGTQYRMKVAVRDNSDGATILVTPEGVKPQPEYGRAFLNGEQLPEIAPLSGITYHGHFQSIPAKLYLAVCFAAFLLMWIITIQTFWKNKDHCI